MLDLYIVSKLNTGFGFSAMWTAFWMLGEECIKLDNRISSVFSVTAGLSGFITPFIIGNLIEKHPQVFLFLEFGYFGLNVVLFLILLFTIHKLSQKTHL